MTFVKKLLRGGIACLINQCRQYISRSIERPRRAAGEGKARRVHATMRSNVPQNANKTKTINLALQGGGAHGAFTWGVLDRLLEDERLVIEAIGHASTLDLQAWEPAYH